jgi:magnesium-transporting ATPase (P-type)
MLQRMGISLSMLTVDNSDTALAFGEQIGCPRRKFDAAYFQKKNSPS